MRETLAPFLVAATLLTAACQSVPPPPPEPPEPAFPGAWRVVDLTRPLDAYTPYLAHADGFPFERIALEGASAGRSLGAWSATDLMGTHIETPAVFGGSDDRVDRLAVSDLVLPTVVIDAPPRLVLPGGEAAPAATGLSAIYAHEARYGSIPRGALVILRTGEGDISSHDLATAERSPDGHADNAGWSLDAVRFLVRERGVRAIGTDTLTLDPGADVAASPAAREAARIGALAVGGLANLSVLPRRGAVTILGVMPVAGAPAAPARVLAFVPPHPPRPHRPVGGKAADTK